MPRYGCNEACRQPLKPLDSIKVLRPVMALASLRFIEEIRAALNRHDVPRAVTLHDSATLFDWIMSLASLQGISDQAAATFQQRHGSATWAEVDAAMRARPPCPRLRSYWNFECGFRKASWTCHEPEHIDGCPVPRLPLRKGALNEAAYALALFVRDVTGDDFVGWIDSRLAAHDPGHDAPDRSARMRVALLEPLSQIRGFGPKIWAMILADLLLAADPTRERWTTTGASMIAVDSLVHGWLHRTGMLRRMKAEHAYGPACTAPHGCVAVIEQLATVFDARSINPAFRAVFPRLVQHSIWSFCSAGVRLPSGGRPLNAQSDSWGICNGNRIDDRERCSQRFCPCFADCERVALRPVAKPATRAPAPR